jgi:hypothetical protein
VMQVLIRCHAVLSEMPQLLKQKRPQATLDSLQHMIACITYHVVKVSSCTN